MCLGIDIGSTTIKAVICEEDGNIIYSDYRRHNTDIPAAATAMLSDMADRFPCSNVKVAFTGSVGMGYAEALGRTFVQEVICAAEVIRERYPEVHTLIDIGGEDSKMIFFEPGRVPDIRMNGNCAGGTGAFIDQTASLIGASPADLDSMARKAGTLHPEKQGETPTRYARQLSKELGRIDWTEDAVSIERLVRGLNPWPSAWTVWEGKTMKIWGADVLEKESGQPCGTVAEVTKESFLVQTGKGLLEVRQLQIPGKKRMDADAFLRGYRVEPGARLGEEEMEE